MARIIVINHDETGRNTACRWLRQEGHEVFEADTASKGFEALTRQKPDLVLLDTELPDLSGLEVCRRLKSAPQTALIPVVQTSSSRVAKLQDRIAGLESGADAYLSAPIEPRELIAQVKALLRTRGAERALQERVRFELDSLLSPQSGLGKLELADIIDVQAIQSLMDDWYQFTAIPMSLVDLKGKLLVGVGWQDICANFHRVNPKTCEHCIESDTQLSRGVAFGEFKLYRCKNNMWDVATPIVVGGQQVGNLFSGQFFFEGEAVDYEMFRAQARQYGFEEKEYLSALEKVPRLSRTTVAKGMRFLIKLAQMISQLSYSTIQLARSLSEHDVLTESLRRSEEQLRLAASAADIGVWSWKPGTNHVIVSANWRRLFGASPEAEVTFETWCNALHPEDRARAMAELNSASEQHRDFDTEYRVVHSDGSVVWIVDRGRAWYDESGKPIGMAGVNVDITERKRMEESLLEAKEQLRRHADALERTVNERTARLQETIGELEHFSYAITHDMRAPLRAMTGYAKLLFADIGGDWQEEKAKDFLTRIANASERMDALIRDALQYSKTLKGEFPLQPLEVKSLLTDIVGSYPNLQGADIRLKGEFPPVLANEAALTQCFSNLLGNAVKFMALDTKPHIEVYAEGGKGQYVRFWIQDNGIGIAREHQARIFEMFHKAHSRYEGTGIGLAVVQKSVQRMGGRVGVESELAKGSRFWLELRRAEQVVGSPGEPLRKSSREMLVS